MSRIDALKSGIHQNNKGLYINTRETRSTQMLRLYHVTHPKAKSWHDQMDGKLRPHIYPGDNCLGGNSMCEKHWIEGTQKVLCRTL